ncbi:hypothetical protein GQ457_08G016310 [Hibiscus cannabinus]
MQIASLGKARRQGGSSITLFKYGFCGYGSINKQWGGYALFGSSCACCNPDFCIFGLDYRYSSVVSVPNSNTGIRVSVLLEEYRYPFEFHDRYRYLGRGIGTPLYIHLVSILGNAYRYPSSLMELEYRYWLPSTDTSCLKTTYGVLRSMILYVLVPELVVYDIISLDDLFLT